MFFEKFPGLDGISAWNIFRDISAPIFDLLVIETNRFASQENYHLITVSSSEIQKFVGFIILPAYNSKRNFRDYWSKSKTLEYRTFTVTMSPSRFQQMKSFIHMCKMMRLDALNVTMMKFGNLHIMIA